MASGGIDLSKAGKYPIVLSDALLGKTTKEVYTSIRCTIDLTPLVDQADKFDR